MSMRLSILKLAAAGAAALPAPPPRLKNDLFKAPASWSTGMPYLRAVYQDVFLLWNDSPDDAQLYSRTEPKLRELLVGLEQVSQRHPNRTDVFRMVNNARRDFETAKAYASGDNLRAATIYLSYALMKVNNILDGLTAMANKLGKRVQAYGYDVSGEVMEPGEQESRSPNLWDNANSPKNNKTNVNPANSGVDPEADEEFPELEDKNPRVNWPARVR
jgi:hypothetical protein